MAKGKIVLPEYVFVEHPTLLKDKVLILKTAAPQLIGEVWRFNNIPDRQRFLTSLNDGGYNSSTAAITGYNILVVIRNAVSPDTKDFSVYDLVAEEMADLFYQQRMVPNEKYFKRYAVIKPADKQSNAG